MAVLNSLWSGCVHDFCSNISFFLQSFWSFVDPLVSDEIKVQLLALRNSESDIKKCRVSSYT